MIPNSEVRGALGGARLGCTRRWGSQWLYQIDTAPDLPAACAANDGGECGASNFGVWDDARGWTLSPAYDLNPVPTDVKARILTTRITPDEATCSLDLVEEAAGYFALSLPEARRIIREVATATAEWRVVARNHGLRKAEVDRMASAFEHEDSRRALTRG